MQRRQEAEQKGTKKRRVEYATFQKWQRDHQTMAWLDCVAGKEGTKKVVAKLKCKVCSKFVDNIRGRKNFSEKLIAGADSVRISNVHNHTQNDQHAHVMSLLRKQCSQSAGLGPSSYAPTPMKTVKLRTCLSVGMR